MSSRYSALYAAALLALGGGFGCSTVPTGDATFHNVTAELRSGGSYYHVSTLEPLKSSLRTLAARVEAAVAKSRHPEQLREQFQSGLAAAEMMFRLAGLDEPEGYGLSSYPVDPESGIFENRAFLALPPSPRGFLWNLFGETNHPLSEDLAALPADTMLAIDLQVDPGAFWRALESTDKSATLLKTLSNRFLQMPPEQLLAGLSGEWGFLLAADPEFNLDRFEGMYFVLTLPDADRLLFDKLAVLAQLVPGSAADGDTVLLGPIKEVNENFRPILTWTDGRLTLFSGKNALDRFSDNSPRLSATPEFARLCEGLPKEGSGYLYVGRSYSGILREIIAQLTAGVELDLTEFQPESLTIFRNEKGGKLAIGRSNWDFNQYEFAQLATLPALLALYGASEWFEGQRNEMDQARWQEQCLAGLEQIGKALFAYADAHDGTFPAGSGIAGFAELLKAGLLKPDALICPASGDEAAASPEEFTIDNSSYLYFDGFSRRSPPKLPLVIDWPLNHENLVNVLLVDGTIETLQLEGAENCRRVVSYLHTIHRYEEADFRNLMKKAGELDQQFNLD